MLEARYDFVVEAVGQRIRRKIGDFKLEPVDNENALLDGCVSLIICESASSSNDVRVTAADFAT